MFDTNDFPLINSVPQIHLGIQFRSKLHESAVQCTRYNTRKMICKIDGPSKFFKHDWQISQESSLKSPGMTSCSRQNKNAALS